MCFDKNLSKNNRGFTLLELVVTVVILALVAAPFLSSFVGATRTNVESKRQEESSELAQYIIEQFKASTLDFMETTYGMTKSDISIVDSDLSSGYSKTSSEYKVTGLSVADLVTGSSTDYTNYTVDIELTPIETDVNRDDAIPSIDGVDREKCLVMVDNLKKYDVAASDHRNIEISIRYDYTDACFYADATIETLSTTNAWVSGGTASWKFEKGIPSVYMLYSPLSVLDTIKVVNQVQEDDYTDFNDNSAYVAADPDLAISPDKDKVNVYIINQKDSSSHYNVNYDGSRVTISEPEASGTYSYTLVQLFRLYTSKEDNAMFKRTVVYSNIWETTSTESIKDDLGNRSDKKDTVNGTIKLIKSDTIYNITVTVYHNGKYIAKYESSKTVSE